MSQEFDNNALNLVKQKRFYSYEYIRVFGKFKEQLLGKEKFYSSLTGKKNEWQRIWTCSKCLE